MTIPEGFSPHFRKSKFTDPWEPLFSKVEDKQVRLGVELSEAHCNSRGLVHGAFLAALADNSMGLSCALMQGASGRAAGGTVTVNLTIDYLGKAEVGEWVDTEIDVVKAGRSLCFTSCLIATAAGPVARANAIFKVLT
jgi:uncharacterized protein (TIGR00369 family)